MSEFSLRCDEICVVMTTFEPDISIIDRVTDAFSQVGCLVLVNDSGSMDVRNKLNDWLSEYKQVRMIHNIENIGIAASLNVGIRQAKKYGYSWLLTLDDDSKIYKNYIFKLLHSLKNALIQYDVGVISLSRYDGQTYAEEKIEKKRGVITSGSLFSIGIYELVGGFREDLFIDLVDYDFCIKIRNRGYDVLKSNQIGMLHPVGKSTFHNVFGLKIQTFNHPSFRKYYMSRNSVVLAKEVFFSDPLLSLAWFLGILSMLTKVIFFEKEKLNKIKSILIGVIHGVMNKMGKVSK